MISKVNESYRRRYNPYNKRRAKAPSKSGFRSFLNVVVVSLAIILVSVIAVRAYLTAETEKKKNAFASAEMTYTDTDTVEPNGKTYTIQIDNDTKVGTLKSGGNNKSAHVHNSEGADKKPVFVRVTMVMNIYDSSGVNVTREYPDCTPGYQHSDASAWSADWVMDPSASPACYYYKHVLTPGSDTSNVFDSVTIANADKLPENATVKIRVITDTVQAVATDDMDWTEADYTNEEVAKVWQTATAWVVTSGGNAGQVTWTFN